MLPTLALIPSAWAHRVGVSYVRVEGDVVRLTFARPELAEIAPMPDLEASRLLITEGTFGRTTLTAGGQLCVFGDSTILATEADGVEVHATADCPTGSPWVLNAGYLADLSPGHRIYVEVEHEPVAVLDVNHPTATFTGAPDRLDVALRFGELGVHHIWTGYDHLCFLAALVLVTTRLRDMLFVVTGFTIAHSITLSLAATGVLTLSPAFVEPAIGLTIAFVGVENLWRPTPRRRVVVTFLLGLVHGFGFAGVLAELGLPSSALALALVSFNLGVETGQAVVCALLLPMLLALHRFAWWPTRAVPALSIAIAIAGLVMFVTRILG